MGSVIIKKKTLKNIKMSQICNEGRFYVKVTQPTH